MFWRGNRKIFQKTLIDNDFFISSRKNREWIWWANMDRPIFFLNMVNDEFQQQPLWEADKRIKLDRIRLDCGDIGLTIQWYEQFPLIF